MRENHSGFGKVNITKIEYDYSGPDGIQRRIVHAPDMLYVYHRVGRKWNIVENYPTKNERELK